MIHLDAVSAVRAGKVALRDVDLEIPRGTVTAMIGPNGAGKSTMLGLISGRLRPTAGTVTVDGKVAEVLQATAVDPQVRLTVHDVVCMGRYPTCGRLRRFRGGDRDAVDQAIEAVELGGHRRATIDQLSGGQRQRALIAQGIAQEAEVLLLDEPAAGLDVASQRRILEVVRAEADRGRTVVFSTHHLPDAAWADLVIVLDCSCVCCDAPDVALDRPDVRSLFDPFAPGAREDATKASNTHLAPRSDPAAALSSSTPQAEGLKDAPLPRRDLEAAGHRSLGADPGTAR